MSRITFLVAVVLALAALLLVARIRYPGKAPVKLRAENCDASLWNHVYEKERLRVIEPCTAVEGRVVSIHRNSDGDVHINLDPENKSVLNVFNLLHGRSELIAEVICDHTATVAAAKAACGAFHSQITIPKAGDRVRVTGSYVSDHGMLWNEVHPITRIEILR